MTQLRIIVAIGFFAILGYSALWYTVAFRFEKELAKDFAALNDQGLIAGYSDLSLGGFPYRIILTLDNPKIAGKRNGFAFSADKLDIITHLWTPSHYLLQTNGTETEIFQKKIRFKDGYARASVRKQDDGRIVIAADSYELDDFELERAPSLLETMKINDWKMYFRVHDTPLAPASTLYEERFIDFRFELGGQIADLTITGGVSGPTITDWDERNLVNWRDEGGLAEFDEIKMNVGGLNLIGDGSLTLDERLKLLGSLSFSTRGAVTPEDRKRLIDYIRANGIRRFDGSSLKLSNQLPEAITLQNGQIILNGTPLRELDSVLD